MYFVEPEELRELCMYTVNGTMDLKTFMIEIKHTRKDLNKVQDGLSSSEFKEEHQDESLEMHNEECFYLDKRNQENCERQQQKNYNYHSEGETADKEIGGTLKKDVRIRI